MITVSVIMALFASLAVLISKGRLLDFYVLAIFLILLSIFFHNGFNPAESDYARSKRLYFFIIFPLGTVIFPLALLRFDGSLGMFVMGLLLVTLLFSFLSFTLGSTDNIRRSGIELNPAMHAKLLFFGFLYLMTSRSGAFHHPIILVLCGLGIIGSIQTGSRGSLLIAVTIYFFYQMSQNSVSSFLRSVIILFTFIFLIFFGLQYAPDAISERFTLASFSEQSYEGNRLYLINLSFSLIADHPYGVGMGNMASHFWVVAPHNIFLELFIDFGFLIAIPFSLLVLYGLILSVLNMHSDDRYLRFFCVFFIFMFCNSLIGGELSFPNFLLYLSLGCLHFYSKRIRRKRPLVGIMI